MIVDLPAFVRVLSGAGVDYIIIGGVAGALHGAARSTYDLDVVYSRSDENVARLVAALSAHHPYLRGAPPNLPFVFDAVTVKRGLNFTLTTDLGDLDLLGEVVGGGGCDARHYGHGSNVTSRETLMSFAAKQRVTETPRR